MTEKNKTKLLRGLEEDLKIRSERELIILIKAITDKFWFYINFPELDEEMRYQMRAYVKIELLIRGEQDENSEM